MGVWACSSGSLIFGVRLTGKAVDQIMSQLKQKDGEYLEDYRDWVDEEDEDEPVNKVSVDELNIRLNHWLKMRRVRRALVTVVAGIADAGSPLHAIAGEPGRRVSGVRRGEACWAWSCVVWRRDIGIGWPRGLVCATDTVTDTGFARFGGYFTFHTSPRIHCDV